MKPQARFVFSGDAGYKSTVAGSAASVYQYLHESASHALSVKLLSTYTVVSSVCEYADGLSTDGHSNSPPQFRPDSLHTRDREVTGVDGYAAAHFVGVTASVSNDTVVPVTYTL